MANLTFLPHWIDSISCGMVVQNLDKLYSVRNNVRKYYYRKRALKDNPAIQCNSFYFILAYNSVHFVLNNLISNHQKIRYNSYYLIGFIFLNCSVYCQSTTFSESSLWVKNSKIDSISLKSKVKESKAFFNFNPVVDFTQSNNFRKNKNLISNRSSIFVVFKSSEKENNKLITLQTGLFTSVLTAKNIQSGPEIKLNKGNPAEGIIVSYQFNKNSILGKKKGTLMFENSFFDDKDGKNQLMELLYYPEVISAKNRQVIESYLSIKYGISLMDTLSYLNSAKKDIWDYEKNHVFNNRVTGIGRDDGSTLYQKQSGNSQHDGLFISIEKLAGSNALNKNEIPDMTYFIWGDNNENAVIEQKNTIPVKKLKRVWKMQTVSENHSKIKTQLLIERALMPIKEKTEEKIEEEFFWLAIDTVSKETIDYHNALYIKASVENEDQIVFEGLQWKSNASTLFTITKAPEAFLILELPEPSCIPPQNETVSIKTIGITAPYLVRIKSNNFEKELTADGSVVSFDNLPVGNYTVTVLGHNKTLSDHFTIGATLETAVTLSETYYLSLDNTVEIIPTLRDLHHDFTYEWTHEGVIIGAAPTLTATATGNYQLQTSNASGCEAKHLFSVKNLEISAGSGNWSVFPNPAQTSEMFTVRFNLQEVTEVSVDIYDISGKLLSSEHLGAIKDFNLKNTLKAAGTYLISVSKNGTVETLKLIVK